MAAEISIPVAAIVERRRIDHPWAEWSWRPVAAIVDPPAMAPWHVMVDGGDVTRYHAGTKLLTLHRKLVEAYRINLARETPSVWIMLHASEPGAAMPWELADITASPYEAQDHADSGEGLLEAVPMPPELIALTVDFLRQHPEQEEFRKRKRDKVKIEELKFGKEPIYKRRGPDQGG